MTLLALAVRPYLVLGPMPAAANKPMLAATTDRTVFYLGLFAHEEILVTPIF